MAKKTYGKIKAGLGVAGGLIASAAGATLLPAVGVGVATWLAVKWLDK